MLGVAAKLSNLSERDLKLIAEAGIGWLRSSFPMDYASVLQAGSPGKNFCDLKRLITDLKARGLQIMGITPSPFDLAERIGVPGTDGYFQNYGRICAFLAQELSGLIDWWQVGNELDIWIFRDKLNMEESARFLKSGLGAMREAAPGLKLGINITLFPSLPGEVDGNTEADEGITLARSVYGDPSLELDYAGFDSYPGTWRRGGPESWSGYLDGFHELTGKPVVIQEFGYASRGDLMSPEEQASDVLPCHLKKWRFSWKGGHTPEIQADFLRESMKVFRSKPYVLGATYYSWKDSLTCWQCRSEDCPCETAWGLLDSSGKPKPSYTALKSLCSH